MVIGVDMDPIALVVELETIQLNLRHEHVPIQHRNIMDIIVHMMVLPIRTLLIVVSTLTKHFSEFAK